MSAALVGLVLSAAATVGAGSLVFAVIRMDQPWKTPHAHPYRDPVSLARE
ncbi:MAG: hypothetical protein HYY08_01760 [Firmicutes bacterium]|nr:hypothetical protein [Bacillota bacterium]